jgi:tRNA (guanine-N7-)-methyltransferase
VSPLWSAVFGNDRPVEVEVGPGRGDVLVAFARARPDVSFFAIEHARGAVERLAARLELEGVTNARVITGDAVCIVRNVIPPASVTAYHVYFPDPWPKRRHHQRRVMTPEFAEAVGRTLVPGGRLHVATDLPWLYQTMARVLDKAGFVDTGEAAPARPTTRFERKYSVVAGTFAGSWAVRTNAA